MAYLGNTIVNGNLKVLNGISANSITQNGTAVSLSTHTHSYVPLAGGTMTGDLLFSSPGETAVRQIRLTCATNDYGRIAVGGTAANAGYMELSTADDGTEPIYVRQYTGVYTSLVRTATLLDGSGNTTFPGTVTASSFSGSIAWGSVTGKPSTFTPASHNHSQITTVGDQRSTATTPSDYSNTLVFKGLKNKATIGNPSGDSYSYLVGLKGWSDHSGGGAHELAFNNTGINHRVATSDSAWGSWESILTSNSSLNAAKLTGTVPSGCYTHNHDSTYLKLAGGTLTGALTFANGTWNTVGDDVQIGDFNKAGTLGVRGANGTTTIGLVLKGSTTDYASISYDGTNVTCNKNVVVSGTSGTTYLQLPSGIKIY